METPKNTQTSNGLTLKRVAIDTYHENVAYLHRDCAVYRAEGFQALSKVEIRANGKRILASLNVVDDASIVGCNELGVSEDAFARLEVADGHPASVSQAEPPESIPALFRKINGERLTREDFHAIVRDIAELRYSKIELTAFVVASNRSELDREEVYFLSEAMVASGRRLDWREPLVVDKHCIGGIPGNRTSMLVVPIVAAYGLVFPKTSSRAITSPAGTADTMEVLANVELPFDQLTEIVREVGLPKSTVAGLIRELVTEGRTPARVFAPPIVVLLACAAARPGHPDKAAIQARVLAAIVACPGATRRRLVAALPDVRPRYVHALADDLVRQGLVRSETWARSGTACVRYTVAA